MVNKLFVFLFLLSPIAQADEAAIKADIGAATFVTSPDDASPAKEAAKVPVIQQSGRAANEAVALASAHATAEHRAALRANGHARRRAALANAPDPKQLYRDSMQEPNRLLNDLGGVNNH